MRGGGRLGVLVMLVGCAHAPVSRPTVKSGAPSTPTRAASGALTPLPPAARTIPELTFEKFRVDGKPLNHVFAIDGATVVTTDNVVGYIEGDRVEWIAKIPKTRTNDTNWKNIITSVEGKYLDRIDLIVETDFGRASLPMWMPLTGKGGAPISEISGHGSMLETLIGETALLATVSPAADTLVTVRGPNLTRKQVDVSGCTKNTWYMQAHIPKTDFAAVQPQAFLATAGTGVLVSLGARCRDFTDPHAEVWPAKSTTSKLVDLKPYWKSMSGGALLFRTGTDDLWAVGDALDPVLLFHEGAFQPIAKLDKPVTDAIVAANGQLQLRAGDELHRWTGTSWELAAKLTNVPKNARLLMDASGGYWASAVQEVSPDKWESEVYRLRESRQVPAAEAPCESWFVVVAGDRASDPKAQDAELSKMMLGAPKNEGRKLVEIAESPFRHHIGIPVATKPEADELVTYVKTALPRSPATAWCHAPKATKEIVWNEK